MTELGAEGLKDAERDGFIEDPSEHAVLTVGQQQLLQHSHRRTPLLRE